MMTLLVVLLLSQQVKVTNTGLAAPVSTRCVNTAGTAFESCGGSGGAGGASWFPDGGSIGSVVQGVGLDGGRVWAVEGQVAVTNPTPAVTYVNALIDGGSITVANFPATQPVSGPLTDLQLRATPVPVSGTVTTGGLTDTQLRATPVPVSVGSSFPVLNA